MKVILLALLSSCLFATSSWANFSLQGVGTHDWSILKEAERILPTVVKADINQAVSIEFKKLDRESSLQSPCLQTEDKRKQIYGYMRREKVVLNHNFIPFLSKDQKIECRHGSMRKLLIATIIHEVMHLWEHKVGFKLSNSDSYLRLINAKRADQKLSFGQGTSIRYVENSNRNREELKNNDGAHSPDPYELTSAVEHFAVNMEYYLMDSKYACKRPNLSRYYDQVFQRKTSCEVNYEVPMMSSLGAMIVNLSPKNVQHISYIQAGKGEAMMSRFGHSMIGIKLFEPEMTIVVGFAAEVTDVSISSIGGMFGKYPSVLSFQTLDDVKTNYNKLELREVSDYPLILKSAEIRNLLEQILVYYWEYSGKYFFFSNNCAVEALTLLQAGIEHSQFKKDVTVTPKGLLKDLNRYQLVDHKQTKTFPSYTTNLKKMASNIKADFNWETYLKQPLNSREDHLRSKDWSKKQLLSLLALEYFELSRMKLTLDKDFAKQLSQEEEDSEQLKLFKGLALRGEKSVVHHYGIPLKGQINVKVNIESKMKKQGESYKKLKTWHKSESLELYESYEAQENFIKDILSEVKEKIKE
jgi:hypothetical protein